MKLTIFGASRGVGRAAAEIAAARGHMITAVARSPLRFALPSGAAVLGDATDAVTVAAALRDADAVLVALGTAPGKRDAAAAQVCSRATRVILGAMRERELQRIVVVSSYGIGPTRDRRPFPFNVIASTLLKDVMADKEVQEREVRASDRAWTIAQPMGLTDAPATGSPFVSADGSRKLTRVARADVAAVCLDAIERERFVRETIAISGTASIGPNVP